MKELSIEEKARRYDEAIEIAKDINNEQRAQPANVMTRVFPELKNREDVRIELLNYLYDVHDDDEERARWIAWLEKQGENIYNKELSELLHKVICRFINDPDIPYSDREKVSIKVLPYVELLEKQGEHVNFLSKIQIGDKVTRNEDGMLVNLSQLHRIAKPAENQGEQKELQYLLDSSDSEPWSDEQTRINLINFLKSLGATEIPRSSYNRYLSYLEKQGEQKQEETWPNLSNCLHDCKKCTGKCLYRKENYQVYRKENYQDEQKPADKVEPKFEPGDWVMLDRPVLITKVEDMPYNTHQYWTSDGTWFGDATKAKLWTIKDAKDGDVLAYNDGSLTIFHYRLSGLDAGLYMSHVLLTDKIELKQTCAINNVHPATKEQRDLLFQKMKEAGYTLDAEKKELKKIEQESSKWSEEDELHIRELKGLVKQVWAKAERDNDKDKIHKMSNLSFFLKTLKPQPKQEWSEEDEEMLKRIIDFIPQCMTAHGYNEYINWLKSIKDRVLPQPKQEWSEEDEEQLDRALYMMEQLYMTKSWDDVYNWLKSLKDRILPKPLKEWSEEDENRFNNLIYLVEHSDEGNGTKEGFIKFINRLKSLKDRVQPKQEWSEKDTEHIKSILERLDGMCKKGATFTKTRFAVSEDKDWLKSIKDRVQLKQEWSEEDKNMIGNIRSIIEKYAFSQSAVDVNGDLCEKEYIDADYWLKSLIYRYTWKPSDDQIKALDYIINHYALLPNDLRENIKSLLEQLKKLK